MVLFKRTLRVEDYFLVFLKCISILSIQIFENKSITSSLSKYKIALQAFPESSSELEQFKHS